MRDRDSGREFRTRPHTACALAGIDLGDDAVPRANSDANSDANSVGVTDDQPTRAELVPARDDVRRAVADADTAAAVEPVAVGSVEFEHGIVVVVGNAVAVPELVRPAPESAFAGRESCLPQPDGRQHACRRVDL